MASIGSLNASLTLNSANFNSGLRRASQNTRQAQTDMSRSFSTMASGAKAAFGAMAGAAAAVGFGALLTKIGQVNMEYQKLQGMLFTATGSELGATKAMAELTALAAKTPFALNQVVEAAVKLKNLNLDSSTASLMSYGNTASAMGKDIIQLIEAVADASTGEFERLKEFGIKAASEGNKVAFTFQGTTKVVEKEATAIQNYLLDIGNTKFAGSMDRQAATLGGALSNLSDNLAQLAVKFGEAGFAPALEEAMRAMNTGTSSMENFASQLGYLTGSVIGTTVQAFQAIADNMDKIAAAAKIAATVIASRYAIALGTTAVAAASAFVTANAAAIAGMLAYATVAPVVGTATMALAGLRAGAMGVMALFGGPWGFALTAAAAGVYFLHQRIQENTSGAKVMAAAIAATIPVKEKAKEAAERLASATGQSRKESLAYAQQLRSETQQLIVNTKAKLENAKAKIRELQAERAKNTLSNSRSTRGAGGGIDPVLTGRDFDSGRIRSEQNRAQAILTELNGYNQALRTIDEEIAAAQAPVSTPDVPTVTAATTGGPNAGGSGNQQGNRAQDVLDDLRFQGEQLSRNAKNQEIWNNLRSAGVSIESAMGAQIAAQTRDNQASQKFADDQRALIDLRKEYETQREEVGLTERELAILNIRRREGQLAAEGETIVVNGAAQAAINSANAYFDAKEAREALTEAQAKAKALAEEQAEALRRRSEDISRVREQMGADLANIGIRAFDSLIRGSETFGKTFKNMLADLGDMMLDVLVYEPLRVMMAEWAKTLSGTLGNFIQSVAGNIVPGLAAGGGAPGAPTDLLAGTPYGKALGGPVQGGQPYYVGERGAEMFVPDRSGFIIPNRDLGGGGVSVNVNVDGSTNPAETRKHVEEGIAAALPMITEAASQKTMRKLSRPRLN